MILDPSTDLLVFFALPEEERKDCNVNPKQGTSRCSRNRPDEKDPGRPVGILLFCSCIWVNYAVPIHVLLQTKVASLQVFKLTDGADLALEPKGNPR